MTLITTFFFLSVRPENARITSKREPLSAGRDYLLECKSYGSRPPATITWWKNSKFMKKAESQVCSKFNVSQVCAKKFVHCCIKCPQNLQVNTFLQTYTAFICRIYNEILLKVFDPRNRGNLLLKLQFFVLQLDFFL